MRIAPRPGVMVAVVKLVVACARYPDARAIISACEILRSSVAGDEVPWCRPRSPQRPAHQPTPVVPSSVATCCCVSRCTLYPGKCMRATRSTITTHACPRGARVRRRDNMRNRTTESSAFAKAMFGPGVLAIAADSTVLRQEKLTSLHSKLHALRWGKAGKGSVLSGSHISARVPNVFCAQPIYTTDGCGPFDVVLLFAAGKWLWSRACLVSLFDACGHNACVAGNRSENVALCPTSEEDAKKLCRDGRGNGPAL